MALPAWSTAMQKLVVGQEMDSKMPELSILVGLDQDDPAQVSSSPE
jgi:hypothetical protein